MSLLSANVFASLVVSLVRRGSDWRKSHVIEKAQTLPLSLILPKTDSSFNPSDAQLALTFEKRARMWAAKLLLDPELSAEGRPYAGIVKLTSDQLVETVAGEPVILPGQDARFASAVQVLLAKHSGEDAETVESVLIHFEAARLIDDRPVDPWHRFAKFVIGVSLDVLADQPQLLGGGKGTQRLVSELLPNVAARYDASSAGPAGRLAHTFFRGGLETLINRPDLASREPRWQVLISGVLEPVQIELEARLSAGLSGELRAHRSIAELFEGPIAARTLEILAGNADDYLKGEAAGDRAAGFALRQTLGAFASNIDANRTLRTVFNAEGLDIVVRSALRAAAERPDLFLPAGIESDNSKTFLSQMAEVLKDAPRPFSPSDGVAGQIAAIAIEAVSEHAAQRLVASEGANPQSRMSAALAAELTRTLFGGMKSAVEGNAPVLDARFSRTQAVALLRLMAQHVAQSPDAFFGTTGEPRAKTLAAAVVQAIAADKTGLLTAENWRHLIGEALRAALGNPGTLFEPGPHGCIMVRLSAVLLEEARTNMDKTDKPHGRILFGDTLQRALLAAFDAASTGMLNAVAERSDLDQHLGALRKFIRSLNDLAGSDDPAQIISNREWIALFRHYAANVLARGPAAVEGLNAGALMRELPRILNTHTGGEAGP